MELKTFEISTAIPPTATTPAIPAVNFVVPDGKAIAVVQVLRDGFSSVVINNKVAYSAYQSGNEAHPEVFYAKEGDTLSVLSSYTRRIILYYFEFDNE